MHSALLVFRDPLVDFKTSLQRVRDVADDVLANTGNALMDPGLRKRHETTLCAVVVILSGLFESFLRGTAEAYADDVAKRGFAFAVLPETLRFAHFSGGGTILYNIGRKNIPSGYRWVLATAHDVARRLASVNGPPPYDLLWEAFAETRGNPGPDVIKDFLGRFGVRRPMEILATHIQKTHTIITTQLNSFIAMRNECAHTGIPETIPTASEVNGYCDLLEETADGIVSVLSAHTI
jgi:hypothetical protein